MRQTNAAGIALIKKFEGLRLKAYPDPGTGGAPWTIGYGHTGGVKKGDVYTTAQAEAVLKADLREFESAVSKLCGEKLNDNQFAALVSFAFNCGTGNLAKSSLLKKVLAHDVAGAADEFLKWDKAAGRVMVGLTTRRKAERALFLTAV